MRRDWGSADDGGVLTNSSRYPVRQTNVNTTDLHVGCVRSSASSIEYMLLRRNQPNISVHPFHPSYSSLILIPLPTALITTPFSLPLSHSLLLSSPRSPSPSERLIAFHILESRVTRYACAERTNPSLTSAPPAVRATEAFVDSRHGGKHAERCHQTPLQLESEPYQLDHSPVPLPLGPRPSQLQAACKRCRRRGADQPPRRRRARIYGPTQAGVDQLARLA